MIVHLSETLGFAQDLLLTVFVVFLRLGALFSVLPGLGERALSIRVRLVLSLALSVLLAPMLELPVPANGWALLSFQEILVGLMMGLSIRFLAQGLLIAGAIAAQATSLAQLFGSAMNDGPQPSIALVFYWSGLALFMLSGMPREIIIALAETYTLVPLGKGLDTEWSVAWGVSAIAHAFGLGFTLAAPFVVAALLYNLAMGVINKAMPQLMVAFVGAPALTAGGLVLVLLAIPLILTVWHEALLTHGLRPFGSVR